MATFSVGPCLLGNNCLAPTHELRKWCPGCYGLIHVVCVRVLEDDEGRFKVDSVVCPHAILRNNSSKIRSTMVRAYCCIYLSSLYVCFPNTFFGFAPLLPEKQQQTEPA
jgi:hypothetical protein